MVDANLVQLGDERIDANMQCLLSIIELALRCTLATPDARISMEDSLSTLQNIRLQFVNSRHRKKQLKDLVPKKATCLVMARSTMYNWRVHSKVLIQKNVKSDQSHQSLNVRIHV